MKQIDKGDRTLVIFVMMFTLSCMSLLILIDNYENQTVIETSNLDCYSKNLTYSYYNYTTGEVTHNESEHKVCNEVTQID